MEKELLYTIAHSRVYTLEKFVVVSSEGSQTGFTSGGRNLSRISPTTTPSSEPSVGGEEEEASSSEEDEESEKTIGASTVQELPDSDGMRRTTMGERSTTTTTPLPASPTSTSTRSLTTPAPVSVATLKEKAAELVKRISAQRSSRKGSNKQTGTLVSPQKVSPHDQIHIVSRDTAATSGSAEVRFPAQHWQIPPSLAKARQQAETQQTGQSHTRKRLRSGVRDRQSYEQALQLYMRGQQAHPTLLPGPPNTTVTASPVLPPVLITELGVPPSTQRALSIDARPLSRPSQPGGRGKYRATFAKHLASGGEAAKGVVPLGKAEGTHLDESESIYKLLHYN